MRIRPLLAIVLAFCLTFVTACSGDAQAVDRSNITYDDIRNTGKANDCPTLPETARGSIPLTPGNDYQLSAICMHPSQVFIKGEPANKRQAFEELCARCQNAERERDAAQMKIAALEKAFGHSA